MKQPQPRKLSANRLQSRLAGAPEILESRDLLAVDMLVSVFNDTGGLSVLRYDEAFQPVPGGVPTSMSVAAVQGLAVAPDGTFFVSSLASGQVFHYDNAGGLLGVLGAGDTTPAPLQAPAALSFGPNGNLYVADLQSASIFQFDTSSPSQQYLPSETLFLGYAPGGFDFEDDGELVVGDLFFQGLNHYDTSGNMTVWIEQGSGIHPAAVLIRPDGNVLIGDITLGMDPFDHHQVLLYDVSGDSYSQFINLTFPVGTGDSAGYPPQPTSLVYAPDGDLLVGLSPDQNGNGAIQRYNADTGAYIETLVSSIGTPTGIAFLQVDEPVVGIVGRHIFYNQSSFDGGSAAIEPVNDNAAIATDKTPYLPLGTTAVFDNITSYSRGINGIMVDIGNIPGPITASDFIFKVGNNNTPSTWAAAPAPSAVSLVPGGGIAGSDRVIITWPSGSIMNTWLEVQVLANANTGLVTPDVHFWGNKVGDSGTGTPATTFVTNTTDSLQVFATLGGSKPITDLRDYNRDGQVNTTDSLQVFANLGSIVRLNVGPGGPFAPEAEPAVAGDDGGSAVASALAISTGEKLSLSGPVPAVIHTRASEPLPPRDRYFAEIAASMSAIQSLAKGAEEVSVGDALLDELVEALSF